MLKNNNYSFRYLFVVVLFFILSNKSFAQTPVRVMRIHYNDGAVSEVPVALVDSITFDYNTGHDLESIIYDSITSNEVLQRAYKMASFQWIPLKPVPKRGGGFYLENIPVTGAPYSSVKEINTYLFQDVSYHTFMTAVHSPMSVLYTEDISQPPYHGTNCATYYGTVCSSSVAWALGIDIPYSSGQIINLPDMTRLEHQVIDSLKVCDVIWKSGHVQMIYDVEYREDTLYRITTFETSGSNTHIRDYTPTQFLNMWNNEGYVGYRYNKLIYSTGSSLIQDWEPIAYNDYLCPSKGDRSVYRTTDTVTIHIYNSGYDQIVLAKGADVISSENYDGDMHQYVNLKPGIYSVFLQSGNERTAMVSFEIIETNVSYEWNDDSESITIFFDSSAVPEYAALSLLPGGSKFYTISEVDRWRGCITVPKWIDQPEYYCKVLFKGEYGRIINVRVKVEYAE